MWKWYWPLSTRRRYNFKLREGSFEALVLTHDVEGDPGLLRQRHVVVGGHAPVARPHVAPVQPLDRQRVLHQSQLSTLSSPPIRGEHCSPPITAHLHGALLVGDVCLVYDGGVSVPQHAGRGLACISNIELVGERLKITFDFLSFWDCFENFPLPPPRL